MLSIQKHKKMDLQQFLFSLQKKKLNDVTQSSMHRSSPSLPDSIWKFQFSIRNISQLFAIIPHRVKDERFQIDINDYRQKGFQIRLLFLSLAQMKTLEKITNVFFSIY